MMPNVIPTPCNWGPSSKLLWLLWCFKKCIHRFYICMWCVCLLHWLALHIDLVIINTKNNYISYNLWSHFKANIVKYLEETDMQATLHITTVPCEFENITMTFIVLILSFVHYSVKWVYKFLFLDCTQHITMMHFRGMSTHKFLWQKHRRCLKIIVWGRRCKGWIIFQNIKWLDTHRFALKS